MIKKLLNTRIYVLDHDQALGFYRDILGFEVHTDKTGENGFRWLTVSPNAQPDFEIALIKVEPGPVMSAESAEQIRVLLEQGAFGFGVFETDDCRGDYEAWSKKGVRFKEPPRDQYYGIEATVQDNSGNWFSLIERKK